MLVEQHLHLGDKRPGYVGVICTDVNLREAAEFAALKARQVCIETYGVAPEVVVSGDGAAAIPHIPAHVDYMLYELLKNAARAVVERHHHNNQQGSRNGYPMLTLPSIGVKVCDGGDDVTVRVSDQGGGIAPRFLPHVWSYGFSTVGMDERQLQGWLGQNRWAASTSSAGGGRGGDHSQPQVPVGVEGDYPPHLPRHQTLWDGAEDAVAEPAAAAGPEKEGGIRGDAISGSLSARQFSPSGGGALEEGQQGEVCAPDFLISGGMYTGAGGMYTGTGDFDSRHKMAGLGFGLPLARLYARYFGGDLSLMVLPGYGTDAYLTLKRLEQG